MTFSKNIRSDILFLSVIILVSIGVIFYRFVDIPHALHYDEVEFARLAVSLDGKPYAPYSPLATGHATMYFYILLFSFKLFGVTPFALRLPAAIFGVLTTVLFYFIMKVVFSKEKYKFLPFIAAFTFITSRWYFNFARFSFEATFLMFLEFAAILAFFIFRENKKLKWIVISGIFTGLAYNSYTAGRLFVALPLFFLIINTPFKKLLTWRGLKPIASFLAAFIILILPITIYLSMNKDTRVDQLFFVMNHEMTVSEKAAGVWQNITGTLGMFHIKGDVNGVHNYPNKPILNPIIGILFVIGLVLSILKWKEFYNTFFLAYFFLSIFPAILTYPWENPHLLRTITAIPALVYFVMLSIIYSINLTKFKNAAIAFFCILLLASAVYELRTYFLYHAPVLQEAFRMRNTLPYYIKHPEIKIL
jgi:4-amino-4-deoxy-L-arabinose transferase-like glycosyltransferase